MAKLYKVKKTLITLTLYNLAFSNFKYGYDLCILAPKLPCQKK